MVTYLQNPNTSFLLDSLSVGASSHYVVVRVFRFWEVQETSRNEDANAIVILMIDEQGTVAHGYIPPSLANSYFLKLREGAVYKVDAFQVYSCTKLFRVTQTPYVIKFTGTTRFSEVVCPQNIIPTEKYGVKNYNQIIGLANTNLLLPDFVGKIVHVEGPNIYDPTCGEKIIIHVWLEPFGHQEVVVFSTQDTSFLVKKIEKVSIAEIVQYAANPSHKDAEFISEGRVGKIISIPKWNQDCCTNCFSELTIHDYPSFCHLCESKDLIGDTRFHLAISVNDASGDATFIMCNEDFPKISSHSIYGTYYDEVSNNSTQPSSNIIQHMVGSHAIFKVRINNCNFSNKEKLFTATRISATSKVNQDVGWQVSHLQNEKTSWTDSN